jgi:hypothetical protein
LTPTRWFWFMVGAGGLVGMILLVGEQRPLGGTITLGEMKILKP